MLAFEQQQKHFANDSLDFFFLLASDFSVLEYVLDREMLKVHGGKRESYEYYMFLDEDVETNTNDVENSMTTFEDWLLETKPAVGYIKGMVEWQTGLQEYGRVNVDAIINAFHKTTIGLLVPYVSSFDNESWYYSLFRKF